MGPQHQFRGRGQNHGLPLPPGASFLELTGYSDGFQITQAHVYPRRVLYLSFQYAEA